MFLQLFGRPERSEDLSDVEMLDLETLRARIGAEDAPPADRRREEAVVRYDGRASSPRRTWRDSMRPPR